MSIISRDEFEYAMQDINELTIVIDKMTDGIRAISLLPNFTDRVIYIIHAKGNDVWRYCIRYFSYGIHEDVAVEMMNPADKQYVPMGRISSSLLYLHLSSILAST